MDDIVVVGVGVLLAEETDNTVHLTLSASSAGPVQKLTFSKSGLVLLETQCGTTTAAGAVDIIPICMLHKNCNRAALVCH